MKPHRVRMTHNLVVNYRLYRQMDVFRPKPISSQHMTRFHSDDYINFLRVITQDNMQASIVPNEVDLHESIVDGCTLHWRV